MTRVEQIKKRLQYLGEHNLFDAHYIDDMNYLILKVEKLENKIELMKSKGVKTK